MAKTKDTVDLNRLSNGLSLVIKDARSSGGKICKASQQIIKKLMDKHKDLRGATSEGTPFGARMTVLTKIFSTMPIIDVNSMQRAIEIADLDGYMTSAAAVDGFEEILTSIEEAMSDDSKESIGADLKKIYQNAIQATSCSRESLQAHGSTTTMLVLRHLLNSYLSEGNLSSMDSTERDTVTALINIYISRTSNTASRDYMIQKIKLMPALVSAISKNPFFRFPSTVRKTVKAVMPAYRRQKTILATKRMMKSRIQDVDELIEADIVIIPSFVHNAFSDSMVAVSSCFEDDEFRGKCTGALRGNAALIKNGQLRKIVLPPLGRNPSAKDQAAYLVLTKMAQDCNQLVALKA